MKGNRIIAAAMTAVLLMLLIPAVYAEDEQPPETDGFAQYADRYHYQSDSQSGGYKMQSSDGGITIDFETETIYWSGNTPQDDKLPRYVSFDGGRRWKGMRFTIAGSEEREAQRGNFSEFLNKESDLRLTTALDPKTKQPQKATTATESSDAQPEAEVYIFPKIKARAKMDRFTVEYLTDTDYWLLTNKKGTQTMVDLQVAYSLDARTPAGNPDIMDDRKFGLFREQSLPSGTRLAVPVLEGQNKPGERIIYIIRIKPTADSAGSKPKRITIQTFGKRPKLRVDYKKGLIKMKSGIQTVTGGTIDAPKDAEEARYGDMGLALCDETTSYAKPYVRDDKAVKEGILLEYGKTYGLRFAATGKRPASMPQAISVAASAVLYESDIGLSIRGTTVVLPSGYEARNPANNKWVKSIKADKDMTILVRTKNTAKYNPSTNVTQGGLESKPIYLDIETDVNEKGRTVITAVTFLEASGYPTYTEKAAYIRAAKTVRTVKLKPGKDPEDIEVVFNVKGKGSFVWSVAGLEDQDAYSASYADGATAFVYNGQTRITLTGAAKDAYKGGVITIALKDGEDPGYDKFYCPTVTITLES